MTLGGKGTAASAAAKDTELTCCWRGWYGYGPYYGYSSFGWGYGGWGYGGWGYGLAYPYYISPYLGYYGASYRPYTGGGYSGLGYPGYLFGYPASHWADLGFTSYPIGRGLYVTVGVGTTSATSVPSPPSNPVPAVPAPRTTVPATPVPVLKPDTPPATTTVPLSLSREPRRYTYKAFGEK